MKKSDRSVYTPIDFMDWRESNSLNISPKFQRRGVWKTPARSYFIDTILHEMPVPPLYLRIAQDKDRQRVIREVVDGQQRISAVLDYIGGKFRLSKNLDAAWRGKEFDELTGDEQTRIKTFSLSTEIFHGITDGEVLDIFARLNTYSVPLNKQELRNGKFFGAFKQCAYKLAHEHIEFWRGNEIFTDRMIARMLEVEFTSELLIAEVDGMQDKKSSIDQFYDDFDVQFAQREKYEQSFCKTIDAITESLEDSLAATEFRRTPLFYTLFCVVCHRLNGLPRAQLKTEKKPLSGELKRNLREAVLELSDLLVTSKEKEGPVSSEYREFISSCISQTDNIRPRQVRFETLYKKVF